ncbi:hypothetical protein BDN70DRAFT_927304 [Pholiota conissans]|uniref:Uncharacterized protein n=1 Tax=Pholiota conissans TaxID=109636 RepID=A0A9P5ZCE5_9AGAR|nr:hypothetical protein BDN70DRAFT_927304 [Pholiota conissans]
MGKDIATKKPKAKKPVHYRARHKVLEHVPKEDTNHKFEQRIPLELPQGGTSEPGFCSVLDYQSNRTDVIEMNNDNYLEAPKSFDNWDVQLQEQGSERRRSRPSPSRSMVHEPEISLPSHRRHGPSRASNRRSSSEADWNQYRLGGDKITPMPQPSATYPPYYPALDQQITHLGMEYPAPQIYAPQTRSAELNEQLAWQMEDRMGQQHEYSFNNLPNATPEYLFSPSSHETELEWNAHCSLSLPVDVHLIDVPAISSGGQPLSFPSMDFQYQLAMQQNILLHGQQNQNFENHGIIDDQSYLNWHPSAFP